MQSLTDAEKTRLENFVQEYKALAAQGLSQNRWKKEKCLLEIYDLLLKMISLSRLQSRNANKVKRSQNRPVLEGETQEWSWDEFEEYEDVQPEEQLGETNYTEPLSSGEDFRLASLDLAINRALNTYDPDRGSFLNWFWMQYRDAKSEYWKEEKEPTGSLQVLDSGICVYEAPDVNARVLRRLTKGRSYKNPEPVESEGGDEGKSWYKFRLKVGTQMCSGYVLKTEGVQYLPYTRESIFTEDEDGETVEKMIPDPTANANGDDRLIREEMFKYTLFAEFLAFHRVGPSRATSGGVSKTGYYHMFFTEDIICTLQTMHCLTERTYPHETLIMQNLENSWLEYLLVKPCSSFTEIAKTPIHTYHELLENRDYRKIKLSIEDGVEIGVREPYMRKEYAVTQDHNGLKTSISRNRTSYRDDRRKYAGEIIEKPIDKLVELYYKEPQT